MFVEDYTAREDVFNRAAPLLGLIFIAEMLGAGQLDWPWWQNLLAVAAGLLILLVGFGALNLARGREFSAIPARLGYTELAGFVLIPATLPLIFGGQAGSALGTIAANLASWRSSTPSSAWRWPGSCAGSQHGWSASSPPRYRWRRRRCRC